MYELAQYAQTFLDEFRPRKRTPPPSPPPIETIPENDVCSKLKIDDRTRILLFRMINKSNEKSMRCENDIQKKRKNNDIVRLNSSQRTFFP